MSPATHLLASWAMADRSKLEGRDAALVAWAGLAPDLDGLGAVVDVAARMMHLGDPGLYARFHHSLLHGIFGAVLISTIVALASKRRLRAGLWSLLIIHFHLLCDLAGSRGLTIDDVWPVPYLAPFSDALTLAWRGQWPLNAWPNVLFTALLMLYVIYRSATAGRSPVSMLSPRWNLKFAETVQARWRGRLRNNENDKDK